MKAFIITISCLVAVSVACVSTNVVVDKLTKSPVIGSSQNDSDENGVYDDSGNAVADNGSGNANGVNTNGGEVVTDANGNKVVNKNNVNKPGASNNSNQNQGSQNNNQGSAENPLGYSAAQLVNYYNTCLRKTYSQPKITVSKSESIDLQLGEILLNGKPASGIQNIVDSVVSKNSKPKSGTKTFSSNPTVDPKERYILPAGMSAAGVRNASASKSGSGYVVNFLLQAENCNFDQRPPYNNSCTFPLDFTEIDFGALGQITSAKFYYSGTTLRATIDGNGRVVQTHVVMPLEVSNAQGKGMGQEVTINSIKGTWTATNSMSF